MAQAVRRQVRLPSDDIIEFCELLPVPEGMHVGQPIRLREWQRQIIREIYDTPTRQAIVTMGRKNGKTSLIAMLVLAHLIGPQRVQNGHIFSSAQSRDQASIVFGLAAKMLRMSGAADDANLVVVRDSAKELFSSKTGMRYKALSAEAKTAFGMSPVLVIHDELGQVRGPNSALYDALETAMGAQERPLSLVISTQAPTSLDLMSQLVDLAKMKADPELKLILYGADETDALDDPATWAKANPALGDFLSVREIEGLADRAKRMPSFENSFRNLHLNQRVSAESSLFARGVWEANGGKPNMAAFSQGPVYGGLDLSGTQDMTALVLVAEGPKDVWNVWPHFWTPADTLRDRAQRDRAPYDYWVREGYLNAVPGVTVDYEFVAHRLAEIQRQCRLKVVRFDKWNMPALAAAVKKEGITVPFEEFRQGYISISPALNILETVALQENLRHGMHPVLTMNANSTIISMDPAGNRKFEKQKSTARIDGIVALAMALHAARTRAQMPFNARAMIG